jgi:hypothetical protein
MKTRNKFLSAGLGFALMITGAFGPGRAQAVDKVLSVSPAALKPADFKNEALPWVSNADAFYFANNLSAPVNSYAYVPLNLPQGARIKSMTVHYTDNACGVNQELVVTLMRHDLATGKTQAMAWTTTEGVPCIIDRRLVEDKTVTNSVVNNARYSYALYVIFYDGIDRFRFHGAVIVYQ